MLPLILKINIKEKDNKGFRLWLPLFLIWLILLPFAIVGWVLLIVIGILATPLGHGRKFIFGPIALMRVLFSLRGLKVDVDSADDRVFVEFK